MSDISHGDELVTKQELSSFYQGILPYLGGMPEMLANKFSKGDLYSTDEKIIGTWIDGKPLYQKTVEYGSLPNNTAKAIAHNIANVGIIFVISGVAVSASGNTRITIPNAHPTSVTSAIHCSADTTNITIITGVDRSALIGYVTLQYTKTTDSTVNIGYESDYSTTEKIVGTWIDGKPIYQKTVSFGALPNKTIKTVAHGISNIASIVRFESLIYRTDSTYLAFMNYLGNPNEKEFHTSCYVDKTNMNCDSRQVDKSMYSAYFTIQYTKTTD